MINDPNAILNGLAGAPLFSEKFLAYSSSNSSHGMIFDMITQRFSSLSFHSLGILKFSTVDFLDSFLGYIVQCSGRRGGASLFTHFRPFFCTFFLATSPPPFFNNAFSFIQQALNNAGIIAKLTTTNFAANFAAQFTFGTRTFVAINNATAGFSATTDAIIEVTGLTGTLATSNFVIV
jgi:hypothetical protein